MPRRASELPFTNTRILLVDDNTLGLTARKTVLEELGCRTFLASTGMEALDQFSKHRIDLVVTDYRMPRMDGVELISRLRSKNADLPIVLISGFADALGLNEENTKADIVIQKSNNEVSHLVRAVSRLVRRKKPPRAERPLKAFRKTV